MCQRNSVHTQWYLEPHLARNVHTHFMHGYFRMADCWSISLEEFIKIQTTFYIGRLVKVDKLTKDWHYRTWQKWDWQLNCFLQTKMNQESFNSRTTSLSFTFYHFSPNTTFTSSILQVLEKSLLNTLKAHSLYVHVHWNDVWMKSNVIVSTWIVLHTQNWLP